jgi:Cytochrome c7 and related cytochrome c
VGRRLLELTLLLGGAAVLAACGARPAQAAPAGGAGDAQAVADAGAPGEVFLDHSIHAGKAKMPCLSCHVYADKSPVAGLPSGRKCMGCHKFVAKEKPGVQLLASRVEEGRPLRWQRVFAVPDFIYFSHRVHVRAKVDCKACHGDMAFAKTIRQDQPFTMGRCLACHEERKASRDCLACHK